MNEIKLKNTLGMAQRARLLVSGNFAVEEAIKKGKAKMIILAADSSETTINYYKKMVSDIPIKIMLSKETLGQAIGKEYRAVAAILDEGFSKTIMKLTDIAE